MPLHVVTGALGYTGRYIARDLLDRGARVRTLTNSLHRENPFGDAIEIHPLHFDDPAALVASLRGAAVLYNTYWVRYDFDRGGRPFGYDLAVRNTRILFDCARRAGVGRVVHISVANARLDSDWGYFRGKALLDRDLAASGLSHAIVRPTVVFGGPENVFVNNIAWLLRRFPVFGTFGRGRYRLTPIHVADVARICVDAGAADRDVVLDAVGPETFTYRQWIVTMARALGLRRLVVPMPDFLILLVARWIGARWGDIVITRHEIAGLRDELMYTGTPPLGTIRFTGWLAEEADSLGRTYVNDLSRRR